MAAADLVAARPQARQSVGHGPHDELAGGCPILALDMYEHSYHIDYGAKAATYVDTFMQVIRWRNVDRLFTEVSGHSQAADKTER